MLSSFVGCQPIYKPDLVVYGFELLFRSGAGNLASFEDGDRATAALIMSVFTDIGLDNIVGDCPAFINVTRNFILDGHALSLPRDRVVLEVLEDIRPDPEIIDGLRSLSSQGYRIALDDFVYSPQMEPLIDVADIVKVELPAIDDNVLPRHVELLRKSNVQLLAEKIETHKEFESCRELEFDFYQGFFLSKPQVVSGKSIPGSRIAAVQLIGQLADPDVDVDDVVKTMRTDPSLCYKLLKYINSAAGGHTQPVESLTAAITHMGLRRLQSFTIFTLFATGTDAKPIQLIVTAMTRGRMCELLSIAQGNSHPETYFLAGLFSTLDALLDQPLQQALSAVPLAEPISNAILNAEGPLAAVLTCVLNYEQGEFESVGLPDVDADGIRSAYIDAVTWARKLSADVAPQ
ncbi:MAG: HDOD domain-containing protein [Fuerstiella sp.]|nr:HDOD domain-containing protein [Fuerstiella sp.]MCP4784931.1 HDOD domain-containing protein [Fuerstiella sp.]MCP4858526.1 HDOD domain-containing protein [Fuerstiella sp.]